MHGGWIHVRGLFSRTSQSTERKRKDRDPLLAGKLSKSTRRNFENFQNTTCAINHETHSHTIPILSLSLYTPVWNLLYCILILDILCLGWRFFVRLLFQRHLELRHTYMHALLGFDTSYAQMIIRDWFTPICWLLAILFLDTKSTC